MKIKLIREYAQNNNSFELALNEALYDGWRLIGPLVAAGNNYIYQMLYKE